MNKHYELLPDGWYGPVKSRLRCIRCKELIDFEMKNILWKCQKESYLVHYNCYNGQIKCQCNQYYKVLQEKFKCSCNRNHEFLQFFNV